MFKLRIEKWHPAPLNKLMMGWHTAMRLKAVDRKMVGAYCKINRIPLANGPREVSLLVTLAPKQRACDPDAYWKSLLDALVNADMLIDDNRQYVRHGAVDFERGAERATLITLTDL